MRKVEYTLADFPMPDSMELECKLLNSLLTDMTYFSEMQRVVKSEFFSSDKNKVIWCEMTNMYNNGEQVDVSTIYPKVDRKHFSTHIIPAETIYGQTIIQLGSALRDTYIKRVMYLRCLDVFQGINSGESGEGLLGTIEDITKEVSVTCESNSRVRAIDVINSLADDIQSGKTTHIATPFPKLNYFIYGGLGGGQLIILAARPSVGKTTLGLQMAQYSSRNGFPTSYYSLEMTDKELVKRLIVGTGLVSNLEMSTGNLNWQNYELAAQQAVSENLYIDYKTKALETIATNIILDCKKGTCKVAFVDYLGLVRHDDSRKTFAQVIGDITGRLKSVAMECDIPIVLLCQLNRESAKENRSPQLTDLRDSGAIEQDADIVMMLERPRNDMGEIKEDYIDLWLRKNRGGNCTFGEAIHLKGNESYSDFHEIAEGF